mgnify:CR=1 FL=1
MNKKKINIFIIILIYLFIYIIFRNSNNLSNITFLSLKMYILKVFPFLFIMMILNNLLIKCNLPYYFNKIFKNNDLYIFFSSILSGSPINAVILKNYLENDYITVKKASKILAYTSFNNPLFLYNYLYLILNNNYNVIKVMGILYISNFILYIYFNKKNNSQSFTKYKEYNLKKELFNSIYESIQNLIKIMGIIIFFKIILDLLMTKDSIYYSLLKGLVEVTTGLNDLVNFNISIKIKEIISYIIISFMGLSIQMQMSIILEKYNIDYKYFYISRVFIIALGIILIIL